MRILYFFLLGLGLITIQSFGQKKAIDQISCSNFEYLQEVNGKTCLLSANGNFVLFKKTTNNDRRTTILKNINSGAEKKFFRTFHELSFDKERMFAFRLEGDSLALFDTRQNLYSYLTGVTQYFIIPSIKGDKVAYQKKVGDKSSLVICSADGKPDKEIPGVGRYWLHKGGKALLTKGEDGLTYTDLKTFKQTLLSKDMNIDDAAFGKNGSEVAYVVRTEKEAEFRYADLRSGERTTLLNASSELIKGKWELQSYGLSFDNNEGNVFFKISRPAVDPKSTGSLITKDVNVWSYQDLYLQQAQINELSQKVSYTSIINVKNRKHVLLESDTLRLAYEGNTDKYFILTTPVNNYEFYWNNEQMGIYLFCTQTGKTEFIKESVFPGLKVIGVSPDSRFLIWFDGKDGNYYSYNIESGKTSNISGFANNSLRYLGQIAESSGLIFNANSQPEQYWVANNTALIVHAKNDIWQLDPTGVKKPVNLTNGYGTANDITFRLLESGGSPVQLNNGEYLVQAFNNRTKQNGFWKVQHDKYADPVKLVMSDDACYFSFTAPVVSANRAEDPTAFRPVKALQSDVFVFRKMNSSSPPNLYATSDFKNFKQLSDIEADTQYVQVKSKLISYTLPDGQKAEGILHLPENLDENKKYPIIFNYYERRSEGLNVYRTPDLSGHNINIPWYVSRGYLVFEPDFYYTRGETAQSVINCVRSAITELAKLSYVDTARMGAQGQSFGGYESNVLAIQTNYFKAVCAMAGPTNIISEYGSIRPSGMSNQQSADKGQRNLGVFPWEHPDIFINNSPNFHIGNAATPLLLVHNKDDGAIQFSQAMEVYLGMRRLGKKVWLLEYDGEDHEINGYLNKPDFTIRMQQFFDHYLKDEPAPRWLTRGIPASMKGIDSGLELDTEIKTPGDGIARPVAPGKIF